MIAVDDAHLLVFHVLQSTAVVFTSTSARRVELGFSSLARTHRAILRTPSGEIYVGQSDGSIRRGRPGGTWVSLENVSVPPPPGEEDRWPYVGALGGGPTASGEFELFEVAYGYVARVLPSPMLLFERGTDISSRSRSGLVWLGPDDFLYTLQDAGQVLRVRRGTPQVVLPASEVVGLREVPGLGIFAVTSTLQLLEWVREDGAFRTVASDVSGRDVAIAGNAERLFTLGEEGKLDQYVPGEGLCPPRGFPPISNPSLAVFGRWLALNRPGRIDIFEMIPPL